MAEVHLARQQGPRKFEKIVVVKTVRPALASHPQIATMLLEEARIAALVKHPNVVDIYDLGEADGTFFIAMEYLEGESLASILKVSRQGIRLDPFTTARIVADCASGLHAAHELHDLSGEPLQLA
jgi:serine/threonine-protein kinase